MTNEVERLARIYHADRGLFLIGRTALAANEKRDRAV